MLYFSVIRSIRNPRLGIELSYINKNNLKKILIVDDEIFNIQAIKIILEHRFQMKSVDSITDYAMNGKEAIEKVANNVAQN